MMNEGCFSWMPVDDFRRPVPGVKHMNASGEKQGIVLGSRPVCVIIGTFKNVAVMLMMQRIIAGYGLSFVIANSSHNEVVDHRYSNEKLSITEYERIADEVTNILKTMTISLEGKCVFSKSVIKEHLLKASYSWDSLKMSNCWIYIFATAKQLGYYEDGCSVIDKHELDTSLMGVGDGGWIVPVVCDDECKCFVCRCQSVSMTELTNVDVKTFYSPSGCNRDESN